VLQRGRCRWEKCGHRLQVVPAHCQCVHSSESPSSLPSSAASACAAAHWHPSHSRAEPALTCAGEAVPAAAAAPWQRGGVARLAACPRRRGLPSFQLSSCARVTPAPGSRRWQTHRAARPRRGAQGLPLRATAPQPPLDGHIVPRPHVEGRRSSRPLLANARPAPWPCSSGIEVYQAWMATGQRRQNLYAEHGAAENVKSPPNEGAQRDGTRSACAAFQTERPGTIVCA
jgi:hypothetical protein